MKTFKEFIEESRKFTLKMKKARKPPQSETIEKERGEFERYPNSSDLMRRARTSPVRNLTGSEVSKLSNTDAGDIKPNAQGRRNVRRFAKKYGRDVNRVLKQIKSRTNEPSIAHNGELIAGNTRAMVLTSLNRKVPTIDIK